MKTDNPTPRDRSLLHNRKGFTLIEVMAVLVLLSVVAAVAYGKFAAPIARSQADANATRLARNLNDIQKAVQAYQMNNNGTNPATVSDLTAYLTTFPAGSAITSFTGTMTATSSLTLTTQAAADTCTRYNTLYGEGVTPAPCAVSGEVATVTRAGLLVVSSML